MESFMTMRGKEQATPQKTKSQLEGESQELSQQLENLRRDLAELGTTVRALAQEGSATAQRSVRETTDKIARRGQELAEDARTAGQQAVEHGSEIFKDKYSEFETTVRRHPTTAVAVALGLGYLAGLISRNRS
jgi:ElaB/YqjD/DUF883 family membrane-anchored ribosome-binding protein